MGKHTSEQLTDLVSDGKRPTIEEIKEHYRDTIFWNWADSVDAGLPDEQRRDECEYPLTVNVKPDPDPDERLEIATLRFEMGEANIHVADVFIRDTDESAREVDAEFIACLPTYIPVLFGEIARLQAEVKRLSAIDDAAIESAPCPTCNGSGEVTEAHESYAVETLGCPHCGGSGKRGGA